MGGAAIDVFRDEWGIPHVFAESPEDAWFAQGYVHAQDRLWQLVWDRLKAQGRAASIIGARAIVQDVFIRRIGIVEAAEADLGLLAPDERAMFDRYADGVNAWIAGGGRPRELELLDLEPEPWTAADSLAVWKVRHVFMGSKGLKLWRTRLLRALGEDAMRRLASADGREELLIVPPGQTERCVVDPDEFRPAAEAFAEGSNSWALSGARSASGSPILAGDPHRLLEMPNVYAQMQLACDAFDVVGFAVPGVPGFPHFGQTREVAWCITHAMADDQDLYLERFDADGFASGPDGPEPVDRRIERLEVFDGEPVNVEILRTRRGPVVFGDPASGSAISMRWTGSDEPRRGLVALGRMLEARTAADLDEAMREWVSPCNTMLIADRAGAVRFLHRGRVPIRSRANGWLPAPAWDPASAWRGDVPFEDLPRVVDPPEGWIATANNRVVSARFPHYLAADYAAPNRARRIVERLRDAAAADRDAMRAIHTDTISLATRAFVDALRQIDPPADPIAAAAFALLESFDGDMRRDSAAATIADACRDALLARMTAAGPLAALHESPFPEEPFPYTAEARLRSALQRIFTLPVDPELEKVLWHEGSREGMLAAAFQDAVASLRERFGDDPARWTWDLVHRTQVRHPLARRFPDEDLDPPAVALAGDGDTVFVSAAEIGYGVYHASVARYVFDLADRDAGGWVVPLGAAAEPGSPHRHDQQAAWASGDLVPIVSDRETLRRTASHAERLQPR